MNQNGEAFGQMIRDFQYDKMPFDTQFFTTNLNFNHWSSHMFFMFTDSNNNVIKEKLFCEFALLLNEYECISTTYELLKYDTQQQYGKIEGYYYINLENFEYMHSHLFDTMFNFSTIDNIKIKIKGIPEPSIYLNNITFNIGVISHNCVMYVNQMMLKIYPN